MKPCVIDTRETPTKHLRYTNSCSLREKKKKIEKGKTRASLLPPSARHAQPHPLDSCHQGQPSVPAAAFEYSRARQPKLSHQAPTRAWGISPDPHARFTEPRHWLISINARNSGPPHRLAATAVSPWIWVAHPPDHSSTLSLVAHGDGTPL